MYDLNDIAARVRSGQRVSTDEYLFLLKHSEAAQLAFMVSNNPGNVNNTLRHQLGYIELGFNPNPVAISAQLEMMLSKGERAELDTVKANFQLIEKGLDPAFINALKNL
jgi:hypothetical protein